MGEHPNDDQAIPKYQNDSIMTKEASIGDQNNISANRW